MHLKESANAPDTLERNANAFLALSSEAGPILEEPIQSAISHTRCQAADPVIARFRDSLTNIQTSELERLYGRLPQLDDRSREAIQQFADCLISKMLHPPLECLRNESRKQSPDGLVDALQRLFRLSD
jgi:glutamyl-tRNA reductase